MTREAALVPARCLERRLRLKISPEVVHAPWDTTKDRCAVRSSHATYLGGAGTDVAYSVCVGSAHNARVAGITNSPGLSTAGVAQPAIAGGYDGFVTRLNTTP